MPARRGEPHAGQLDQLGFTISVSLIPYPPGDNAPEKTQMITITHFTYFLLLAPPPKRLGDNGV